MKPIRLLPLLLLAPAAWKLACQPPRPDENLQLPADDTSQGGSRTLPKVPDLPNGIGGNSPIEDNCGDGPDASLSFSKKNLLTSIADCTELRLCEFEASAIVLSNRAEDFVQDPTDERQQTLRSAFFDSMLRAAHLDLFQFGPQASAMKDPEAGQGLRNLIYSWPSVSRCRVEEQLFGKAYESAGFDDLIKVPVNSRGLFAVEYLSFYEGEDNACTQFSITNSGDAWANTSSENLVELKREYLQAVSHDVAARAIALTNLWRADGGNFKAKLSSASAYMDQQNALNLVAHAMLYLETEVKDYKIGAPAGLYENAPLERPEVSFSAGATELLKENLEGFRDLFAGCGGAGLGFDDWLIAAGHGDLAQDILEDLSAAQMFLEDFPDLAAATPQELADLHVVIKRITDHLKTELFGQGSPIGLTLPTAVEGDTD